MIPIIDLLLSGGTIGGIAYLISKVRCICLSRNDTDPVIVMGSNDGSDVIVITAKREHHIC